jgi:hypothetical protein
MDHQLLTDSARLSHWKENSILKNGRRQLDCAPFVDIFEIRVKRVFFRR